VSISIYFRHEKNLGKQELERLYQVIYQYVKTKCLYTMGPSSTKIFLRRFKGRIGELY
jgi:hypothetical protein